MEVDKEAFETEGGLSIRKRLQRFRFNIFKDTDPDVLSKLKMVLADFSGNKRDEEIDQAKDTNSLLGAYLRRYPIHNLIFKLHATLEEMDWAEQIKDDLRILNDYYNKVIREFELEPDSGCYGRDKEYRELFESISSTDGNCPLGIGKSHLIRHVGAQLCDEGEISLRYVNAKGITDMNSLIKILGKKICGADLPGDFKCNVHEFMEYYKNNAPDLLVIDDISALTNNPEASEKQWFLQFISLLVAKKQQLNNLDVVRRIPKKIVLTSQTRLLPTHGYEDIKSILKEIALEPLSEEAANDFVESTQFDLPQEYVNNLVKECKGHPYSLYILRKLLPLERGGYINLSPFSMRQYNQTLAEDLLEQRFTPMSPNQKAILIALSIFSMGLPLEALYHICKSVCAPGCSLTDFHELVRREFSSGFWIRIERPNDIVRESDGKLLVSTYHSLVEKFLNKMTTTCNSEILENMEKCAARYYIKELQRLGRCCLNDPDHSSKALAENSTYISRAVDLMRKHRMVHQLLPWDDKTGLHATHMMICLHHYYDLFGQSVLPLFRDILAGEINDIRSSLLLNTFYLLLLTKEGSWRELKVVMDEFKEDDIKKLGSNRLLYNLTQSLYRYSYGKLLNNAPWCASDTSAKKMCDSSIKYLKKLTSPEHEKIYHYFMIHIASEKATAVYLSKKTDLSTVNKARSVFMKEAEPSIVHVALLKCHIYACKALFTQVKAHCMEDVLEAGKLYTEACHYHEMSEGEYKRKRLVRSKEAVLEQLDLAQVLRSWGVRLLLSGEGKRELLKLAKKKFKDSLKVYKDQTAFMEETSDFALNLSLLYKSYVWQGDCYTDLLNVYHGLHEVGIEDRHYQNGALKYYNKAYNLLRKSYEKCYLKPEDKHIDRLIERLPQLLDLGGREIRSVEKVRRDLVAIKDLVLSESSEKLSLSPASSHEFTSDPDEEDEDVCQNQMDNLAITDSSNVSGVDAINMDVTGDQPTAKKHKLDGSVT